MTSTTTRSVASPTPAADQSTPAPTLADQAPILLGLAAGYVGHRTVAIGLRAGLIQALASRADGVAIDELAELLDLDPFYVCVWVQSAVANGVCDQADDHVRLAAHLSTLLLDTTSPAYVGGVFPLLEQDEVFDRFERELGTGARMWWDDTSPEWITRVAGTGTPFYTRLVPGGLATVPGLAERLAGGGRIVDHACGAGVGLARLVEHFPGCEIVGVDGDQHSLDVARARLSAAGIGDAVRLVHTQLEQMRLDAPAALVVNNISMHECRDLDEVAAAVYEALEPGGWFVISDFPFPDTTEGLRTVPGRLMSGIQFFEAQIDDQLQPRVRYDDLLERHGFVELGTTSLTPMHSLTWGRRLGVSWRSAVR